MPDISRALGPYVALIITNCILMGCAEAYAIDVYVIIISLLILFLDKLISNYGPCHIVINDDKEFVVQGGKNLLRMLFENKYFIPSACEGKSTCRYCKLKIIEGGGEALPTETLILSSEN